MFRIINRARKKKELEQKRTALLASGKRINTILKGIKNKTVTQSIKQKKYSILSNGRKGGWKPLLLRDSIKAQAESGQQILNSIAFGQSAISRYWDKNKAREMMSSGPVNVKESVFLFLF